MERRRQIKEQAEAASVLLYLNSGKELPVPEEQEKSVPAEEFKALQEEYKSKITELHSLQEDCRLRVEEHTRLGKNFSLGRGFLDEGTLKEDDKLTTFYTGLPSFGIFNVFVELYYQEDSCKPILQVVMFSEFSSYINEIAT